MSATTFIPTDSRSNRNSSNACIAPSATTDGSWNPASAPHRRKKCHMLMWPTIPGDEVGKNPISPDRKPASKSRQRDREGERKTERERELARARARAREYNTIRMIHQLLNNMCTYEYEGNYIWMYLVL